MKNKLKKKIKECLERVYNSDGMIESAKADAMRAIDEFADISLTQSQLISECQSRDWNISLTYQKINDWSVEIYTGYKSSYEKKYYSDGHITKETAIETALEFFEEFNKLGK